MLRYNKDLKDYSRELRSGMTDADKLLWTKIRNRQLKGLQFYRQKILGNYIVDFYCPKRKLVIEVDGGQHYENEGQHRDEARDAFMKTAKLRVLRFSNRDVLQNLDGVLERIWERL